ATVTVRLVYHKDDTFKRRPRAEEIVFCGRPLTQWLKERGLSLADIFGRGASVGSDDAGSVDLYRASLYPVGADADRLTGYWRFPSDAKSWTAWFLGAKRFSIAAANA